MGKFDKMNQQEAYDYLEALQREIRGASTDKIMTLQQDLQELKAHIDENQRTWAVNANRESELRAQETRRYTPGRGFTPVAGGGAERVAGMPMISKEVQERYESRATDLRAGKSAIFTVNEIAELRAIAAATSGIVTSSHAGSDLVPGQLQVSSIVDKVFSVPLLGGESYKQGYEIETPDGDVTNDGADSTDAEPTFGYVDINKLRYTAYAELTSQVNRLSPVAYSAFVVESVRNSVRKKLGKHIVAGAGSTSALMGIASEAVVNNRVTEQELSAIDGETLDSIVFGYGGDLATGVATLILKKADLAAFAAARDANGSIALYKIEFDAGNPNAGWISSRESYRVPYVITDQLSALSAAGTGVGTVCMLYGDLAKYFLVSFSDLAVEMSTDYQFKKGNIAFRGEAYMGGATCGHKAFTLIKKKAG